MMVPIASHVSDVTYGSTANVTILPKPKRSKTISTSSAKLANEGSKKRSSPSFLLSNFDLHPTRQVLAMLRKQTVHSQLDVRRLFKYLFNGLLSLSQHHKLL